VGVQLGLALAGTGPLDFLSHRLQHLDLRGGNFSVLLDDSAAGILKTVQRSFWLLQNPWHTDGTAEVQTLEWWAGRDLQDASRSTMLGLSASIWSRLMLLHPSCGNFVPYVSSSLVRPCQA